MRGFLALWLRSTAAAIGARHGLPMESPTQRALKKIALRFEHAAARSA